MVDKMGGSFQSEGDMLGLFAAIGIVFSGLYVCEDGPELFRRLRQQSLVVGQRVCDGRVEMGKQMEHPMRTLC